MQSESTQEQKCAVIVGGTSGIGLALAEGFLENGYTVEACGVGQLPPDRAGLTFHQVDVANREAVDAFMNGIKRIDVLLNAAGIIRRDAELDPETFATVLDINLNGTMRACSAARRQLSECKGSIINIASMLSYFGGGTVPGYAASKGGIAQLTKSLAIAYAADGIRVNALAPGWIATPLTTALQADEKRSASILERTPLGRWGQPADLIGPALFLASDAAGFVTGSLINVDGGYAAA